MSTDTTRKKNQQRSRRAREEWLPQLAEKYPRAFFADGRERKPLKVGIHQDILADADNTLAAYQLTSALRWYTGAYAYQCKLTEGTPRIDLQGEVSGKVTADDAAAAAARAQAIKQRMEEARQRKSEAERAERWMKKLSRLSG